jgi:transposase-like protein
MELEIKEMTGARIAIAARRDDQRNGYRERLWERRAGTVELSISKLRKGSYFLEFLEPRRLADHRVSTCPVE